MKCWGRNTHGQLGRGSSDNDARPLPEPVPGLADVILLATGKTHACAIVRGGALRCWGENSSGEVRGDGTTSSREPAPVEVTALTDVVWVAGSVGTTCAVRGDGTTWCWGANEGGQLGDGTHQPQAAPMQVLDPTDPSGALQGVVRVAVGTGYACGRARRTAPCAVGRRRARQARARHPRPRAAPSRPRLEGAVDVRTGLHHLAGSPAESSTAGA